MKKKTASRLSRLVLALFSVFLLWLVALLGWIYWEDLQRWVRTGAREATVGQRQKPPDEEISEQERKQLEELLRRR